jgi:hypothetical protein
VLFLISSQIEATFSITILKITEILIAKFMPSDIVWNYLHVGTSTLYLHGENINLNKFPLAPPIDTVYIAAVINAVQLESVIARTGHALLLLTPIRRRVDQSSRLLAEAGTVDKAARDRVSRDPGGTSTCRQRASAPPRRPRRLARGPLSSRTLGAAPDGRARAPVPRQGAGGGGAGAGGGAVLAALHPQRAGADLLRPPRRGLRAQVPRLGGGDPRLLVPGRRRRALRARALRARPRLPHAAREPAGLAG